MTTHSRSWKKSCTTWDDLGCIKPCNELGKTTYQLVQDLISSINSSITCCQRNGFKPIARNLLRSGQKVTCTITNGSKSSYKRYVFFPDMRSKCVFLGGKPCCTVPHSFLGGSLAKGIRKSHVMFVFSSKTTESFLIAQKISLESRRFDHGICYR